MNGASEEILIVGQATAGHVALLQGLQAYLDKHSLDWSVRFTPTMPQDSLPANAWAVAVQVPMVAELSDLVADERILCLHRDLRPGRTGAYVFDNAAIGRLAATYFADLGYPYLGLVETPWNVSDPECIARSNALAQAGDERGLVLSRFLIEDSWQEPEMVSWLHNLAKPLGIYCYSDGQANWLRRLALAAGLRIPDEVAILGTNNQLSKCLETSPHLSSISLPWKLLGEAVGRQFHHRILGGSWPEPTTIATFRVIQRESSRRVEVSDELVRRGLDWLRRNSSCRRPLAEAAAALGCAEVTLAEHFRRHYHTSVGRVKERLCLDEAQRLLIESDLTVAKIAKRCGYASSTSFGIAFKRVTGISPGRWRASLG